MNSKSIFMIGMALVFGGGWAHAEWGNGLHKEYKTQFVPLSQQSGWGVKKKAETPKPLAMKPKDSDFDGIIDDLDKCPGTAKGIKVDSRGCEMQVKALPKSNWILDGIQFETNSDVIKYQSKSKLNEAAALLKQHNQAKVEIQGHTDNTGPAEFNEDLSQRRAEAVRNYLIDQGVEGKRLAAKGFGESKPIADNNTIDGRSKNRRIEFKVLKK